MLILTNTTPATEQLPLFCAVDELLATYEAAGFVDVSLSDLFCLTHELQAWFVAKRRSSIDRTGALCINAAIMAHVALEEPNDMFEYRLFDPATQTLFDDIREYLNDVPETQLSAMCSFAEANRESARFVIPLGANAVCIKPVFDPRLLTTCKFFCAPHYINRPGTIITIIPLAAPDYCVKMRFVDLAPHTCSTICEAMCREAVAPFYVSEVTAHGTPGAPTIVWQELFPGLIRNESD